MKRCVLFTGGPLADCDRVCYRPEPEDFVIACDAGVETAAYFGVCPAMAVGDFDSFRGTPDPTLPVRLAPVQKDDTDTLLGVRTGLENGYRRFLIIGGFGGRLDHTIANLQTLAFLCEQGATGEIQANQNAAWVVKNGTVSISSEQGAHLAVFAWGGTALGVTLEGVDYPLSDAVLEPTMPVGVSNSFAAPLAQITVREGTLLVVTSRER